MKVAVTCRADNMDALVDQRFGRCSWFAIYDTDTHEVEFVKNTAKDEDSGAGPAAVAIVADHQVRKIVSGGHNFFRCTLMYDFTILKHDNAICNVQNAFLVADDNNIAFDLVVHLFEYLN